MVVPVFLRRYFFFGKYLGGGCEVEMVVSVGLFAALLFLESIWAAAAKPKCGATFFGKYLGGGCEVEMSDTFCQRRAANFGGCEVEILAML
jgi:hypothetical protein